MKRFHFASADFRSLRLPFLLVAFWALSISAATAQITAITATTANPIPGAGHDYIHLLSETVNPADGSLSLRIQPPLPSGRQLSIPFAYSYDSNGVFYVTAPSSTLEWVTNTAYLAKGGWSYSIPMITNQEVFEKVLPGYGGPGTRCIFYTNYVFEDSTGARHSLYVSNASDISQTVCQGATPVVPQAVPNGGDDNYRATLASGTSPLLVADADGTVYTFPGTVQTHSNGGLSGSSLASQIEDRNGNKETITDQGSGALTVTDTLGRSVLTSSGFGATAVVPVVRTVFAD